MSDDDEFCSECGSELHYIFWLGGYYCTNPNCDQTDINLFNDELDELGD